MEVWGALRALIRNSKFPQPGEGTPILLEHKARILQLHSTTCPSQGHLKPGAPTSSGIQQNGNGSPSSVSQPLSLFTRTRLGHECLSANHQHLPIDRL